MFLNTKSGTGESYVNVPLVYNEIMKKKSPDRSMGARSGDLFRCLFI